MMLTLVFVCLIFGSGLMTSYTLGGVLHICWSSRSSCSWCTSSRALVGNA